MITKERLEELIKQGEKVWCVCDYTYDESKPNKKIEYYDLSNEDICISPSEFRDYVLRVFDALGYWNDIRFECLFETKAEAEWHAEFGCIERTECFELPTWEELQNEVGNGWKRLFMGFDEEKEPMQFMLGVIPDDKIYIGFTKEIGAKVFDIEFEALTTKENYTLACRKCKELFLGESE